MCNSLADDLYGLLGDPGLLLHHGEVSLRPGQLWLQFDVDRILGSVGGLVEGLGAGVGVLGLVPDAHGLGKEEKVRYKTFSKSLFTFLGSDLRDT